MKLGVDDALAWGFPLGLSGPPICWQKMYGASGVLQPTPRTVEGSCTLQTWQFVVLVLGPLNALESSSVPSEKEGVRSLLHQYSLSPELSVEAAKASLGALCHLTSSPGASEKLQGASGIGNRRKGRFVPEEQSNKEKRTFGAMWLVYGVYIV